MNCSERKDQLLLLALGELDPSEAEPLRTHLAGGCLTCEGHLTAARTLIAMIPLSLPSAPPPAGAKARLLERVRNSSAAPASPLHITQSRSRQKSDSPHWFKPAAFGAIAASLLLGSVFWQSTSEQRRKLAAAQEMIEHQEGLIGDFTARKKQTVDQLMMVADPKMKLVQLDGRQQKLAKGFVCWDPESHHYFFCASGLRKLQPGTTYELWLVDSTNAMNKPVPAGIFQADDSGQANTPIDTAHLPESSNLVASAVTIEPGNGGPKPSTGKFQISSTLQ